MDFALTVITPVFNSRKYIAQCLENVAAQNCLQAQHLIMDGGSTDGTVEVIAQYAESHPHITWISEKDSGQSNAMNKGIALAKGPVIGFLNADDYYEPNVLNRVVGWFEGKPEPAFVCGNLNIWNADGSLRHFNRPNRLSLVELISHKFEWPYNPSAYFYHKSIHEMVGLYNEENHYNMDYEFILKVARKVKIEYVDEVWGNFCVVEESKTFNSFTHALEQAREKGRSLREEAKSWLSAAELEELNRLLVETAPAVPQSKPTMGLKKLLKKFFPF